MINSEKFADSPGFENIQIEQVTTESGDVCHYDLRQIEDSAAEEFATKYCNPPDLYVCNGNQSIQLSEENVANLKEWVKQNEIKRTN